MFFIIYLFLKNYSNKLFGAFTKITALCCKTEKGVLFAQDFFWKSVFGHL